MTQSNEQPSNELDDTPPTPPSKWDSFICKLQSVAKARLGKSRHGMVVISVSVIVNHDGDPVLWLEPDCKRIEPSAGIARALLECLVDS